MDIKQVMIVLEEAQEIENISTIRTDKNEGGMGN